MRLAAVLDACVLFSKTLTDALLYPAAVDAFVPFWSGPIREEWTRNLRAHQTKLGRSPDSVDSRARAMDAAFPSACIAQERAESCVEQARSFANKSGGLHPGDVHVMAAAMAITADVIITSNTGLFPERVTWNERAIVRMTPDQFLTRLLKEIPDVIAEGYRRQIASTATGPRSIADIVKRLSKQDMAPHAAAIMARFVSPEH